MGRSRGPRRRIGPAGAAPVQERRRGRRSDARGRQPHRPLNTGDAMTTAQRYRTPVIHHHVEPTYLSDFDTDDIVEYLTNKGFKVIPATPSAAEEVESEGIWLQDEDLARIDTLILCG